MRYVAAYLLSSLGGNDAPGSADIEKILSSVGIEADSEKINKVLSELKGKNVEEVIAAGREKLASVPSGGGAVAAAAAPAAAEASPTKAPEKKEEKKEESDQSDDDMGFGLFD